jgi:class 3 adenylate cyclase
MYFSILDSFLYGPGEMTLVKGYEEIIASEFKDKNLKVEAELLKMSEMRDALVRTFVNLRARQEDVLKLREKLETALSLSFCILGNTQDVEASALLANSILTGRAVKPGINKYLFYGSLLTAFFVCFFIKKRGPLPSLGAGLFFSLLFGAGFSAGFIFTGFWFDPLVPVASCGTGVFVSIIWALIAKSRYSRRFRQTFGPYISRSCLKSIIKAGKPLQSQIINARAAVVAVKNADSSVRHAKQVLLFQEKAADIFKKAGGVIVGTEEDMITVCFGSPLERIFLASQKETSPYENNINANAAPALRAVDLVSEVAQRSDCASWHFGLDTGNCAFAWSAISGYIALGAAVQQAKIFSRIAGNYEAKIIVSGAILEAMELPLKKLDELRAKNIKEPFYRLTTGSQTA